MTQVTRKTQRVRNVALACLAAAGSFAQAQSPATPPASGRPTATASRPAEELYLHLQSVGLDPARAFHIRGVSIDRPALHVLLDDGEIAFTADVAGRITGAIFEGDGEVLLTPPNQGERASLTLFTGMAILEERFTSIYLRFNDETFAELQPYLRPASDGPEFVSHLNQTAVNLAEQDALRLLGTFSRALPVAGASARESEPRWVSDPSDRMLHVRVQGNKLGTFDAYFDTKGLEEVWAGQTRTVAGQTFYDLWTSFTPQTPGRTGRTGELTARSEEVTASRYKIRAQVTPPTTLAAEASLQMEVRRGGERTVYFELSRFLKVKEVEVDGRPVEFINNPAIDGSQLSRRGNDLVAVVFPQPLREKQTLNLRFVYSGDVLSEAGGGLLYVGARGTWYPNRGLAMADFDLEFRYPPGWTLVATGKRVSAGESAAADTEDQVARWVTERPISLAGFNLGRYEMASAQADGVTVKAYAARAMEKAFPRPSPSVANPVDGRDPHMRADPIVHLPVVPSPARNAQAVADNGARAVEFYSRRFGPYPYGSLELTQMPGRTSQGWPGLVFLSSFAFLTHDEAEDLSGSSSESAFTGLTLPHETAHQWWGDLVGWKSYRDQWIVEALANYCALMTFEKDRPGDVRSILERYREELTEKNKDGEALRDAGPVTLGLRLSSSHFPNGYEAISYGRGTWLFHMLRTMLLDTEPRHAAHSDRPAFDPDEPFVRALRKVRDRYAGKAISTHDLFAVFEEDLPKPLWYEGHKSLDWFVQSWVEGTSLPRFNLHNVKYEKKGNETEVVGTLEQKDTPQDYVSAVPVYAVLADKKVLLGTVLADGPETSFHLTAPPGTRKVVVDPYQTMLTAPK